MTRPFWWTTDAEEDSARWAHPADEPAEDELADEEADRTEYDLTKEW
jgi:hypothetical protein